jgi:glutathione S-transferase
MDFISNAENASDVTTDAPLLTIVIGNKTYSSWSLRAWMAVRFASQKSGVRYEEVKLPLAGKNASDEKKKQVKDTLLFHSPTGKIPALRVRDLGNIVIYDSLSIVLYIAERFPYLNLLPLDLAARALCISASAEMHSGFEALRTHCPMNCVAEGGEYGEEATCRDDVLSDLKRLGELWTSLRVAYGIPYDSHLTSDCSNSGYLFGHFTIADCMFAPVALRLKTYDPSLKTLIAFPSASEYVRRLLRDDLILEWVAGAEEEVGEWKIESYDNIITGVKVVNK